MIDLSSMAGQTFAVFGLGRSGLAAAKALHAAGVWVRAWDDDPARRAAAEAEGVPLADLYATNWTDTAGLVLAPGIPHTHPAPHPVAAAARAAGVAILGDIELLARAAPEARNVGITGTNGKSTTTALLGHILDTAWAGEAGRAVRVGGNLGPPVAAFDPIGADGVHVLEMSSYQLERVPSLRFAVAVLLNITPDHLDRHGGLDGYIAAKRRIFEGQGPADAAIVGVDDTISAGIYHELAAAGPARTIPVSAHERVPGGVYAVEGTLIDDLDGDAQAVLDLNGVATLPGTHNAQNAAAAYAAARQLGVSRAAAVAGLRGFPGLAHRQEPVAARDGVRFVNDSKATNAEAAATALAAYPTIYWIAGGRAKAGGLHGTEAYWARVRHAFLIGEAADSFAATLKSHVPAQVCGDLDTAVRAAWRQARADAVPGAVVLLSPACASFDQFPDFEARGAAFRAAVAALAPATVRGAA